METTKQILSALRAAGDGSRVILPLDLSVYDEGALLETSQKFASVCEIAEHDADERGLILSGDDTENAPGMVLGEFLNHLLVATVKLAGARQR